ncbi:indole-3-glycerol phosphate synthase TrpC [Bacillaceae bacterium S4-13-56]
MLDKILATKREEIPRITLEEPMDIPRFSLYESLKNTSNIAALIAEVKKASPSKGLIREDFDPVSIAKDYESSGASAISVLTDQVYFQGKKQYLQDVKRAVKLPVLRKDFIIVTLQIEESFRIGADAILLIGEVLEPKQLHEFYEKAYELGMEVLVEVHSEDTLGGILQEFTPKIIGINNRNLKTFETSLKQTQKIAPLIPEESLLVSESGIFLFEEVERVVSYGAQGILVGEALMRQQDIKQAVHDLLGGGQHVRNNR